MEQSQNTLTEKRGQCDKGDKVTACAQAEAPSPNLIVDRSPLILALAIIFAVGFSSNVIVVVVILKRFSHNTWRTLSLIMGVSDLVATGVAVPLRIWTLLWAYTFPYPTVCKAGSYV
ncbi:hypothetical protein ACOMHN_004705 [Nucella lapillus]